MTAEYHSKQILSKRGTRLVFDKKQLEKILRPVLDSPVAIISVCGDQRKGKSFILNLFLRYLIKKRRDRDSSADTEILFDAFHCRGGIDRTTEGIWMLSKPLWYRDDDRRIALFLMDTQGMFDRQTSKKECAQIFSLTTVMSSFLVFNLMQQIQANDIDNLELWTGMAKWAKDRSSSTLFQNLLFLLRDFPDPDIGYGLEGGANYLSNVFSESNENNSEVNESIRSLKQIFGDVSACTLPRPHESVATRGSRASQHIHMDEIGNGFLEYCEQLFHHMLHAAKPLNITGTPLKGKEMLEMVGTCCAILLGDEMPSPASLGNQFAKFQLQELVDKEIANYEDELQSCMATTQSVEEFLEKSSSFSSAAMRNFEQAKKIGGRGDIGEYKDKLRKNLHMRFDENVRFFELRLQLREKEEFVKQNRIQMESMRKELELKNRNYLRHVAKLEESHETQTKQLQQLQIAHARRQNEIQSVTRNYRSQFQKLSVQKGESSSNDRRSAEIQKYEEQQEQIKKLTEKVRKTEIMLQNRRKRKSKCTIS